ncbi:MAG: site-specific integrase [Lachnospiraceae bacterium]|nr:site-specific integrase [Lachnospiraceae bacterium]
MKNKTEYEFPCADIISIHRIRDERKQFVFKSVPVRILVDGTDRLDFPCIGLYHRKTGIAAAHPGFERWYLKLKEARLQKSETLRKRSRNICSFLNYLLWETYIDRIEDISLDNIRGFLVSFRMTADETERDPAEWARGIEDVYWFLLEYIQHNENHGFRIRSEDLFMVEKIPNRRTKRDEILYNYNYLGVRPPKRHRKKNRFLPESYMEILIFEAEKHDPMIALGMALQAYAGLREGEIVNLTRSSVGLKYGGFGRVNRIEINLWDEAPFAKNWKKKTEFGSIKIYRMAKVYPDFHSKILSLYNRHDEILEGMDVGKDMKAPLFLNEWEKPMSVDTYKRRVKKLFYEHFLPDLKRMCLSDESWAMNAPYIEAYEKEYPGAHMFRHWFTMYLIKHVAVTKKQDIIDIVSDWRGDASREAMEDYLHVNADIVSAYKTTVLQFQKTLLEEVLG